jgi:hypothetical protein
MEANNNNEGIKYLGDNGNINPKKEALTIENLRTFEGFENVSDEEAMEIIRTIDTLCRIVQAYLMNQGIDTNNNKQNLAA